MAKLFLIIYSLIWLTILGGLVYSQSNFATSSKDEKWMVVRTCGSDNDEYNLYANKIVMVQKASIQALSGIIQGPSKIQVAKPDCTQILMVGGRSLHVWGTMRRLMDRINPDHNTDEELWK